MKVNRYRESMLSQDDLRRLFVYANGKLYWGMKTGSRVKKFKIAGTILMSKTCQKRIYIRINNFCYARSRLVWLFFKGKFPKGEISHINRDALDDRIENLRDVTRSEWLKSRKPYGEVKKKYICFQRIKSGKKTYTYFTFVFREKGKLIHKKYSKSKRGIEIYALQWLKNNKPERLKWLY